MNLSAEKKIPKFQCSKMKLCFSSSFLLSSDVNYAAEKRALDYSTENLCVLHDGFEVLDKGKSWLVTRLQQNYEWKGLKDYHLCTKEN